MKRLALSFALLVSPVAGAFAADSVVVFNEINYHPAANESASEWIELHNQMAIDIDLSGWHLEDGVNFDFPEATIIPAGGYRVVASDPSALAAATGLANILGPFTGRLDNSGERLELRDRNDRLMDRVIYADGGKWPLAADGSGATLAKRDPNTTSDPPENWTSSVVVGGTPGARNFPESSSPQVRSLVALDTLWRFEASGTDLGDSWRETNFVDTLWAGQNAATLLSYWPFNGTATATRGTNGSFVGAVTATTDRSGAAGQALAFNGVSQYVNVPGGGGLNGATSGTISLWARWNGTQDADCCGGFGAVLARQSNGLFSDNVLSLNTNNPATGRLIWREAAAGLPALITGPTVVGTTWHHVAVTFSPSGTTLYLDGTSQGTATGPGLHNSPAIPLTIGGWAGDGAGFMNGNLDDVAIWDRPLTAAQVAELAASTKAPLDFANPESAIYFSGDGRLSSNDELRRTSLPLGPVTYYFRKSFQFADDPALTELKLDLAVDDGAVIHLNGAEVYRHNMPQGAVGYSTFADTEVADAPLLNAITVPAANLVVGTNVLAVEVHQAAAGDGGMVFGAGLNAQITPPGAEAMAPDDLVFSEISAAAATPFQVELVNHGAALIDTAGYVIKRTGGSPDAEFVLPSQMLPAGGFVVLTQSTLGFGAVAGDNLYLYRPGLAAVADAVEVHQRPRARAANGSGEFLTPSVTTFGAPNSFVLHDEVVINEILFHAPPTLEIAGSVPFARSPEQWIELFNRSGAAVNLAGWRLDEGIDFRFPANTILAPGGFLVVAKDPAALQAKFPGLAPLGPFDNRLSHSGERILLRDADDNPADSVHYFDDGRWPEAADAGGASLELRDPRADNSAGESWAASNESGRTAWSTYSYTGAASPSAVGPDGQWQEFVLGLHDKGEVLLDDISVIENPATAPVQLIQNGTFDTGTTKWRIIGNHHGTVIDDPDQPGNKVLRLVATGTTEHMSNHAETTLPPGRTIVNGRQYQISFRARWVHGCRQFNTRLYFNRLAKTTLLDAPTLHGTPGSTNTALAANIGPTFHQLRHRPAVPVPFGPVEVSVTADDPDGVTAMTLWWRPDGAAWSNLNMTPQASTPRGFSAMIPGRAGGSVVQFYVEGTDALGAKATFPSAGVNSRALFKVNDGLAKTNGLHNMRLVTLGADATELHRTINLMSNERIGCTLIYDEREIFYDIGLRLKGSEHSRTTTPRLGFNLGFRSEQLFRGVHRSAALDRSESVGFGQREMLIHQTVNHCGGLPTKYHDLVHIMTPQAAHTGSAELQLARYTDVFLDDQFENGSDGVVFEYELVYQLNPPTDAGAGMPEGNKIPAPDSVVGTTIRNLGDPKENYRWTFLLKNNEDRDDYSRLIPFAKWMGTTGTPFTSQIPTYIDVDQWLRGVAINVLSGMGDSYGGDGSQHNVQFYVRPTDGRMLYFPHDMDAFFSISRSIVPNSDVGKIITGVATPEFPVHRYARMYYSHLLDIIATTYNSAYMTRWATHFGQLLPGQNFANHLSELVQRANNVTAQVNAVVSPTTAFAITSNGGNDHEVANNMLTLTGTAPLSVMEIEVNGVSYPITWTTRTAWSLVVPLMNGPNVLTVQGVNRYGVPLGTAVDTITVTNTGPSALLPVVINEFMADNAGPDGLADPADGLFQDWIELFNPNATAVNLSGYSLTDDLGNSGKWPIPNGTIIPAQGFLLVWADRETDQNGAGADLHADFQLDNEGESLGLFNAAGVAQHTLDFGIQTENLSQGLFPDGDTTTAHFMQQWTPLARNTLAGPLRFNLTSLVNGMVTLTWDAIPGRTYRVEYKNAFSDPSWTPLVPDIVATGNSESVSTSAGATLRRFLRVRRLD